MNTIIKFSLLLLISLLSTSLSAKEKPAIQHAIHYGDINQNSFEIQNYLVSEKLDGMRGYWNGSQLLSRQGNPINAPAWFTKGWPNTAIDGELWIARNTFEQLISCVKQQAANETPASSCWSKVKFMMFDLPQSRKTFAQRYKQMQAITQEIKSPYLYFVKQYRLATINELETNLKHIINKQGEGLMLHLAKAKYKSGRNSALIKVKKHQDAEATVLAHIQGKGKYQDVMGALLVQTSDGLRFKIGTGFSDFERKYPPEIGSIITFKYNGKTKNGIPRFARFWRVRETSNKS
ncbi:DNA ligase [Litorilituus sediminis]|uniref:DNA ligase n=1 Tax=Litorilituus sediminis TaxID=718192 RepID=A0A4V0ZGD6_9GAMM|nr:DNA ligase [Litorilituus sediminis]QBG36930.1 DNA ligase [Litorilituus sediminis]